MGNDCLLLPGAEKQRLASLYILAVTVLVHAGINIYGYVRSMFQPGKQKYKKDAMSTFTAPLGIIRDYCILTDLLYP
jgi:hypothetical protein